MMWGVVLVVAAFASGFATGWVERSERLYRRFWQRPAETLDEIRAETRKRHL